MTEKDESKFFTSEINERERACFEAGIKLGALYHILCGIPISSNPAIIASIEKGIESSISCQPYVKSVSVKLNRENIFGDKLTEFDYDELTGKNIEAEVIVEYKLVEVKVKVKWIKEFQYPLMFIERIISKD
jgi:hypothetical protein